MALAPTIITNPDGAVTPIAVSLAEPLRERGYEGRDDLHVRRGEPDELLVAFQKAWLVLHGFKFGDLLQQSRSIRGVDVLLDGAAHLREHRLLVEAADGGVRAVDGHVRLGTVLNADERDCTAALMRLDGWGRIGAAGHGQWKPILYGNQLV